MVVDSSLGSARCWTTGCSRWYFGEPRSYCAVMISTLLRNGLRTANACLYASLSGTLRCAAGANKEFPKKAATMRKHRSLREFAASQPPPPEGEQPAPAEPPVESIDHLKKYGWLPYDDPYTVLGRTIDRTSWATLPRTDTEAAL